MRRRRVRRVFLGYTEIAGYYAGIQHALSVGGIEVHRLDLWRHPFRYKTNPQTHIALRLIDILTAKIEDATSPTAKRAFQLLRRPLVLFVLLWVMFRCDAIVVGAGQTLLRKALDLRCFRLAGVRVIGVFHGSDSRPPYCDGPSIPEQLDASGLRWLRLETARRQASVRYTERFANDIITLPETSHFLRKPFIHYLDVGVPVRPLPWTDQPPEGPVVRILHCPSRPLTKGTAEIRQACKRLNVVGIPVELVEVIGQPNGVVCKALANCDLVVDQIWADTPLATFATESAWAGRPVIVGGYAAGRTSKYRRLSPACWVLPEDVESAIGRLVCDRRARQQYAAAQRRFVESNFSAEIIARKLLDVILGGGPQRIQPDACYVLGCGLSEARTREIVGLLVGKYGPRVLRLEDKPNWKNAYLAMASG